MIALIGIAVALTRWHPRSGEIPVRGIAPSAAMAIAGAAGLVLAGLVVAGGHVGAGLAAGMAITLGLSGGYLLAWGYRSIALLRTVVLLSLLTWPPVGDLTHVIVRSSLQQPSDLIYRRLAQFQVFGVEDEPWRLFTASLHRGSLVVIATLVLAIAASRWRVSARVLLDLALTAVAALVVHHVVVMLSPIDNYEPTSAGQLATDPGIEIALAVGAVLALGLVRARRRTRDGSAGRRRGRHRRSTRPSRPGDLLVERMGPATFDDGARGLRRGAAPRRPVRLNVPAAIAFPASTHALHPHS